MTPTIEVTPLITSTPGVCGGRPCIAGTGVSVRRIAMLLQEGLSLEEIAENWSYIDPANIQAAIDYYSANREHIDIDIAEEEAATDRLMKIYGRQSRISE